MSVVLPAPLGPITACTSPGTDREIDAIRRGKATEALHEAGDFEEAHGDCPLASRSTM
jgi:hypothetical protein